MSPNDENSDEMFDVAMTSRKPWWLFWLTYCRVAFSNAICTGQKHFSPFLSLHFKLPFWPYLYAFLQIHSHIFKSHMKRISLLKSINERSNHKALIVVNLDRVIIFRLLNLNRVKTISSCKLFISLDTVREYLIINCYCFNLVVIWSFEK